MNRVRSLAWLLVCLALSALGIAPAHAQDSHPTEQEAYAHCIAQQVEPYPDAYYAQFHDPTGCKKFPEDGNQWIGTSTHVSAGGVYKWDRHGYTIPCAGGLDTSTGNCFPSEEECLSRSEQTNWAVDGDPATDDQVCYQGCMYGSYYDPSVGNYYSTLNSDTGHWYGTCTTGDPQPTECPASGPCSPDADGDGVPDENDAFPNDPGEDTDSDGDGVGDNGDNAPGDATNGADHGTGNETDNTSTGGGNCATPPQSSGDGIAAQVAFQAWKIRCAIENVTDGNKLRTSSTTTGSGDGTGDHYDQNDNGTPDYLEGQDDTDVAGQYQPGSAWASDDGSLNLDSNGYGFSRSCPAPPTITLRGTSHTLNVDGMCELGEIIAALVLVMAFAHAAWVVAQG